MFTIYLLLLVFLLLLYLLFLPAEDARATGGTNYMHIIYTNYILIILLY